MSAYSFQGRKRLWKQRDEEENPASEEVQRQDKSLSMVPKDFQSSKHLLSAKWSLQQLLRLLTYYRAHRCLWDPNDVDNRNRKLRRAALIDIAAAMGDKTIKQSHVVQKINVLRATYRYEKRRIKQRIRQGIGAKTKLRWFGLADSFLRNVSKTEKLPSKQEAEETDSDLEDTLVVTVDPAALLPSESNLESLEKPKMKMEAPSSREDQQNNLTEIKTEPFEPPRWTARHSLQFIESLAQKRSLWNLAVQSKEPAEAQQQKELYDMAVALKMPIEDVQKRVYILWKTLDTERKRMHEIPDYKPMYVWWPLAEELIFNKLQEVHFVPPAPVRVMSPMTNGDTMQLEEEMPTYSADELDFSDSELAINPIPSVAPPSVASMYMQDAMDELFEKTTTTCQTDDNQSQTNNTKLIWNGLEDDLLEGKWSLKHSVKFLRLYGAHRCLWDLKHPDYRSRELRNAAIKDIAAAMGYGLDAAYVAKKIKIFRITYMQHRKRMLAAIIAGKEPEIQLRWFPLADSFLRPHIGLRSIKDQQREMPQFDLQYVYANLNLIDPALLNDFNGKGTQNTIEIGDATAAAVFKIHEDEENL